MRTKEEMSSLSALSERSRVMCLPFRVTFTPPLMSDTTISHLLSCSRIFLSICAVTVSAVNAFGIWIVRSVCMPSLLIAWIRTSMSLACSFTPESSSVTHFSRAGLKSDCSIFCFKSSMDCFADCSKEDVKMRFSSSRLFFTSAWIFSESRMAASRMFCASFALSQVPHQCIYSIPFDMAYRLYVAFFFS